MPDSSSPQSSQNEPLRIGDAIRDLRARNDISLSALARIANVSKSNLSKIENNAISPTFDTIARIAKGLGVPPAALLSGAETSPEVLSFSNAGQGMRSASGEYVFEFLFPDLKNRKIVPLVVTIRPSIDTPAPSASEHAGEEFFYVLEGEVEFISDGEVLRVMGKGDSVYFSSNIQHLVRNRLDTDAQLLWAWVT